MFCLLFHPKETKVTIFYIDPLTQRPYGRHKCKVCKDKYVANNKYDWFWLPKKQYKNGKLIKRTSNRDG